MRMTSMLRRHWRLTLVAVVLLLTVATVATGMAGLIPNPVSVAYAAAGDYGKISKSAPKRTCSDARCVQTTIISAGTWVKTLCWRDGGSYGGTPRWFRINYGGSNGWVS